MNHATQHARGVFDWFAAPDLNLTRRQKNSLIPTSNETRVRVDAFENNIAQALPAKG